MQFQSSPVYHFQNFNFIQEWGSKALKRYVWLMKGISSNALGLFLHPLPRESSNELFFWIGGILCSQSLSDFSPCLTSLVGSGRVSAGRARSEPHINWHCISEDVTFTGRLNAFKRL